MKTRIYTVTNTDTGKVRMVRASSTPAAISHVAKDILRCMVTDTDSGILNAKDGVIVETAGVTKPTTEIFGNQDALDAVAGEVPVTL